MSTDTEIDNNESVDPKERKVAITSQALYLLNISVLPIVAFVILMVVYSMNKAKVHGNGLLHLKQAIVGSVVAGILLVIVSVIIMLIGSFDSPYTWMVLVLYFISIHSALILYGVFAFIKALVNEPYRYPLIGNIWK